MNDLNTPWIMKWLHQKGVPLHKAYDMVGWLGFGSFMLAVLVCIVIPELTSLPLVVTVLLLVLLLTLLAFSGYCVYMGNTMWLMLLLFGAVGVVIGFAIDLGTGWTVCMAGGGAVLLALGIWLTPRQIKNAKKLGPELEALRDGWKHRDEPAPEPVSESAEAERPNLLSVDALWVLELDVQGNAPVYIGSDGRMELFSGEGLARFGKAQVRELLQTETRVRKLEGTESIRAFFEECAYYGYSYFRLNNGTPYVCECMVSDYVKYRAADPITYRGHVMRNLLSRSKQYEWQLGGRNLNEWPYGVHLMETMLTTRLNGYRELANTVVYALGPKFGGRVCATAAALERLEQWTDWPANLPKPDLYTGSKSLYYVNRPGQTGAEAGAVCAFTDLALAVAAWQDFRRSGMETSVLAVTWEELAVQALQCSEIVLDMQKMNYVIPKREYGKVSEMKGLQAGLLVKLNFDDNNHKSD